MISDPLNTSKFAADCQDLLITGVSESQRFDLLKGDSLLMSETYNYDNEGSIRISGLAEILSQSLYGELKTGEQTKAKATFLFNLNDVTCFSKSVYAMRLQNPRDPDGEKEVLAVAPDGICYPGRQLLLTVIGEQTVRLVSSRGDITRTTIGEAGKVMTVDCDPQQLFPSHYHRASFVDIGGEIERRILHVVRDDAVTVRFLNRYDMPESLTAPVMTEKPSVTDDVSTMYGRRTRFGVTSATEYTLQSGPLHFKDEYDTWQDLLTSRKAQILWHGQWVDIIITKTNYTRQRRRFYSSQAEISFQTANPLMTL